MGWLMVTIIFLVLEVVWRKAYGFWWAMFAFSAYVWNLPMTIFLCLAVFSSLFCFLYMHRKPRVYEALAYDRNSGHYIGREFLLTKPMRAGVSEIEFDDMIWPVYSVGEEDELPVGTWMKVKRTNGVILMSVPLCP